MLSFLSLALSDKESAILVLSSKKHFLGIGPLGIGKVPSEIRRIKMIRHRGSDTYAHMNILTFDYSTATVVHVDEKYEYKVNIKSIISECRICELYRFVTH